MSLFTSDPRGLLNIMRKIKEIYQSKIQTIAHLQTMIPSLVELTNSSLDQINTKIEQDLNELLNCEKTQFFIFNKNSRCFYTFAKDNANQMFKIDP